MPVGSNWLGDDHPSTATLRAESTRGHRQATAEEAAHRGWYYRRGGIRTNPLEPDTRKCACHGLQIFEPLPLTAEEAAIRHPLSTQVLLREDGFGSGSTVLIGYSTLYPETVLNPDTLLLP